MAENYIVAMSLKTRVQIQMFYQQIKSAAADSDLKTYNISMTLLLKRQADWLIPLMHQFINCLFKI